LVPKAEGILSKETWAMQQKGGENYVQNQAESAQGMADMRFIVFANLRGEDPRMLAPAKP
jgi:hypothetical protein